MSVNVSKFTKKKEGSTSVVVNNSSKGYSNTNNNYNSNFGLDRQLWNIHDTGQDITETPTLPALNVNGQINAGGRIHSDTEVNAPTGRFSYLYPDYIYECKEGHISYLYSDYIQTEDLKANTGEIINLKSTNLRTDYLDVTKSAHFAELVIDKIKSVGGSAVFSPADGFKIASEDDIIQICNSNGVATNYWMLCWDGEDDRGATVNMWERNDQALCQNFNEATVGTSYNISNTYFWMLVYTAGTYNPDNPSDIMYDHGPSEDYINQSSYIQETAYNSKGEKITFDTLKHYIIVYDSSSTFLDSENNTLDVRDGIFNPKAGNEVVMLGHRARLDEMQNDNNGVPEYKKRQSAIYIAAYNSTIEPDLIAPLIAQYQGINDFNLSTHRTTHFAAGHNDIFGYDNEIRGSFKTINGTDITDLNGVTYFIKSNKAYIPVTSDWFIGNNAFYIDLDCMYVSGDNGPQYVGNRNSNMRLIIRYAYNGINYTDTVVYDTEIKSTYRFDLRGLILQRTNGYIDSLSFEIAEYVNARHNILYQYNIPVIRQSGSNPGDDAEFYKMNPIRELAQVDVEGNFALYLEYEVQHIIGDEITTADNTDYSIQFTIWDENNNSEQTKTIPYVNSYFTYDKDGNPSYEKVNVFGTYNSRSLLHDQYIEVKLIKNNGDVVVERRVIPITLVAGAMFSVTDSITSRVTASETTANTAYNMASQAVQTANGFEQRVTKTETDISNQQDTITGLQTDISTIQQTADAITSEVMKISGVGGENLLVNSSFQVSEEKDLPEKWGYYNVNTIITTNSSGSINYININNNINQGDGNYRGIVQNSTERYNNNIQDLYPNHIYCFSFYGKKNSSYGAISCFIHYTKSDGTTLRDGNDDIEQVSSNFDIDTTDWQRYCFIFKTTDNNEIFSFNIMLEYFASIGSPRDNDVDIMMPMLLDYGEATEERMDLYGLYRLNGDTHVYDVWKNEDYNVSQVPMWQGNSQDVSISSSQILQTANLIRLQVENCGIDITNQNITLNGDTVVNGELHVNDENTGFIIEGPGGRTEIVPKSVGTYMDFIALANTTMTQTLTTTGQHVSTTGNYYNYTFPTVSINLGNFNYGVAITVNSITLRYYNSEDSQITVPSYNSRSLNIKETWLTGDNTTSGAWNGFTYTVGHQDANIKLLVNITSVGLQKTQVVSTGIPQYLEVTVKYTVPNEAFTRIGYDGIGMNFGNGRHIFIDKNWAIFRYGNKGLRISPTEVLKIINSTDIYNTTWGNLNTPNIKYLSSTEHEFLWTGTFYDMLISGYIGDAAYVSVYLPNGNGLYNGRTVYIRKASSKNIYVYAGENISLIQPGWTNSHNIQNGNYLKIENGRLYKFTYYSNTWYVNRMDDAT